MYGRKSVQRCLCQTKRKIETRNEKQSDESEETNSKNLLSWRGQKLTPEWVECRGRGADAVLDSDDAYNDSIITCTVPRLVFVFI